MKNKNYIGELDFLKFIMALVIMFMHIAQSNAAENEILKMGGFAVEFFFIVSGYFMCCSAAKMEGIQDDIGKDTISFLWKKFKTIMIPYLFAYIAYFCIWLCSTGKDVVMNDGKIEFINQVLVYVADCLLLCMSGLFADTIMLKLTWYISAMLLAMLLIYPMVRLWGQKFRLIVAPAVAIFSTGYIYMDQGQYKHISERVGFTTGGMWRAVIGLCIGCMVYEFANYLKSIEMKNCMKIFLSVCNAGLLGITFYIFIYGDKKVGFIMPTVFFFLISIVASKQNILSNRFDNKLCKTLGAWSMYIYLIHGVARKLIYKLYPNISLGKAYLSICSLTVVLVFFINLIDLKVKRKAS